MNEEEKAKTVADIAKEQVKLHNRLDFYATRFIRLRELDTIEAKVIELDARIAKLERGK